MVPGKGSRCRMTIRVDPERKSPSSGVHPMSVNAAHVVPVCIARNRLQFARSEVEGGMLQGLVLFPMVNVLRRSDCPRHPITP